MDVNCKKTEVSAVTGEVAVSSYHVEFASQSVGHSLALNAVARTRAGVTLVPDRFGPPSSVTHPVINFLLRSRCLATTALLLSIRAQKKLSYFRGIDPVPVSAPISNTTSLLSALACQNPRIFVSTSQDLSPWYSITTKITTKVMYVPDAHIFRF
jgi:hypothetical protein